MVYSYMKAVNKNIDSNIKKASMNKTSWEKSGKWYDENVGEEGHYYHRTLILPKVIELLELKGKETVSSLLDLACGQGVLSRHLPKNMSYYGYDAAPALIKAAHEYKKLPTQHFEVGDVTKPLGLKKTDFTHATIILAIQNIEDPLKVLMNASKHLAANGKLIIVMNHPCFRVPRQSSWKVDQDNKIQFRRIDRYMNSMKIPIQTHPGKGSQSQQTWSFHHPLSSYSQWLKKAGFTIDLIEEWCSNKVSEGGAAKMENRSREEIPLFMAIVATKKADLSAS